LRREPFFHARARCFSLLNPKNPNSFDRTHFKSHGRFGFWVMFGCGQCPVKVFLYNFMQVTWQENWQKCCALGMKTVSLNKYYSSVSIMDVPEGKFSLRKFALLMLKKNTIKSNCSTNVLILDGRHAQGMQRPVHLVLQLHKHL
jgi:hypothetical protein